MSLDGWPITLDPHWRNYTVHRQPHGLVRAFTDVRFEPPRIPHERQFGPYVVCRPGACTLVPNFLIILRIRREQSWIWEGAWSDALLLEHEQGHVDIVGLIAREMDQRCARLSAPTAHALWNQYQALFRELGGKLSHYAGRYERETDRGRAAGPQATWTTMLQGLIANPNGTFPAVAAAAPARHAPVPLRPHAVSHRR